MNYSQAYEKLTEVVSELEDDKLQLDTLADKVKEARELIAHCEAKLRVISANLE